MTTLTYRGAPACVTRPLPSLENHLRPLGVFLRFSFLCNLRVVKSPPCDCSKLSQSGRLSNTDIGGSGGAGVLCMWSGSGHRLGKEKVQPSKRSTGGTETPRLALGDYRSENYKKMTTRDINRKLERCRSYCSDCSLKHFPRARLFAKCSSESITVSLGNSFIK